MWLSSMLLLLLLAVSPSGSWNYGQDELECQPFRRKKYPSEVHCIRAKGGEFGGRHGRDYVCSPTIVKGYANMRLEDCHKRRNWYECPCGNDWTRCVNGFQDYLRKNYRGACYNELVDELIKNITTKIRSTKKPTTTSTTTTTTTTTTSTTSTSKSTTTSTTTTTARPTTTTTTTATTTRTTPSTTTTTKSTVRTAEYESTTTQTWPTIVHTSGAVEVTGATSEHSTTASRSTNGTDMTAEELSPYRAAKIEARRKAALRLLILSTCMFCVLFFQLMFIRMLRNIHRQQYEQYVQNCLKELRAKETTSSEDSKQSSTSAPKSIEKHSGGFFTKIKKTAESTMVTSQMLKSQLPTLQRRISQAPALDDETVTDFYTSGNVKKK